MNPCLYEVEGFYKWNFFLYQIILAIPQTATLWIKTTKSLCYGANKLWYNCACLFRLSNANSLLFCCRFKYVVSWRPRTYNTMWRGIHQAFGQPSVQRNVCRQRKGWLCSGSEVGWWAHPWESLPCYCSLNLLGVRIDLCSSDVELYWVQSCCKMRYLDTHGSHFNAVRCKLCNFIFLQAFHFYPTYQPNVNLFNVLLKLYFGSTVRVTVNVWRIVDN